MIQLPNDWRPRGYQKRLWSYLERGGKRAVAVWHRRSGKDCVALNWTAVAAMGRVGLYWHLLPEAAQGRKVIWDGVDGQGRRIIDQVFPKALRVRATSTDMKIELRNGSIWQVVGSDNFDSLVGANPVGVVFSEFALADPSAWDYIRPILTENGGWALFIFTPRGRNHAFALYDRARQQSEWFAERLGVEDTGVISLEALEQELASGMSEEMIDQEFHCSFEAPQTGSYYGRILREAERAGRIGRVPRDPDLMVETWWDLGVGDETAIWFIQQVGREVRVIDYLSAQGQGLEFYAKRLREDYPYTYREHLWPHDGAHRELGTGRSRREVGESLGLRPIRIVPASSVADGIQAVRSLLPRCWFDEEACREGLEALRQYGREWDARGRVFKDRPRHDWTSHPADAFRIGATGMERDRGGEGWSGSRALTMADPLERGDPSGDDTNPF